MLQEWAKNWQMQFNVQKVMAVHTHTHTHTRSVYSVPASQRDPSTPSTVKKSKRSIIAV